MALSGGRGVLVLLGLLGCVRHEPQRQAGRRVVEGEALAMRASPDGAHVAFLRGCRPLKDRTLPAGASSCELAVVASAGGAAARVAGGVMTPGHGFAWSSTGRALAALADYDPGEARGALVVWAGGEPRRVASGVTFYAFDRPGARLGWVSAGQLFVAAADGSAPAAVAGAEAVSTFEFGRKQEVTMLARTGWRSGGTLLAIRDHVARPVASDVRDYGFGAEGARFAFTAGARQKLAVATAAAPSPAPALGEEVRRFLFAPRGESLAFVADAVPGRQGDLWVSAGGAAPVRLARRVGDPRWAADGVHLAWLQDYDPRSRTGTLAVGAVGAKPRSFVRNVSDFDLTPDASSVAYLVHDTAGGYSVNLGLATTGEGLEPSTVARGVFGFAFSPDGRWLYYRTACTREAEACDLLRIPAGGLTPGSSPERIAEAAKSFEFAPGRPDRLLVGWSRKDRVALDLAVWEGGKLTAVDTSALPGTAQFMGSDAGRLAYVVNDPRRPGVYVAKVP